MLDNKPLVSIGMPVYNGEKHIRQALDSLLSQDYEKFELIVSDNASTDGTPQICQEYIERDERTRYYRNERNMGAAWNFNRVFELSSGEYFMWAAHDDCWDPRYLRSCLNAFDALEAVVLAGAVCKSIEPETERLRFIDQGFSTIGLCPRERFMRYKRTVHGMGHIGGIFYGIYNRSALHEVMPMRTVIANDHLVLAALCLQGEFVTVQEPLIVKRWGGASTSHRNNARAVGVSTPLLVEFPYFVRELLLHRIIFQTDRLTLPEKTRLACWSLGHYVRVCGVPALRFKLGMLLAQSKRRVLHTYELLRNVTRGT